MPVRIRDRRRQARHIRKFFEAVLFLHQKYHQKNQDENRKTILGGSVNLNIFGSS